MGKRNIWNNVQIITAGEDEQDEVETKLLGDVLETEDGAKTEAYETKYAELSDAVRKAVENGDVLADIGLVKRKGVGMQYIRLQAKTVEGCAIMAQGNVEPRFEEKDGQQVDVTHGDNVVNHFNYGKDLKVRNALTQRLATLAEGPDKAIEAAAKNIAKAFGISIEDAREKVRAMAV